MSERVQITVKYFDKTLPEIKNINGATSDWVDLYTAEDVHLEKGWFKLIPLNVAIQLPEGYEALVVPRSSTFKKYGILQANSIGVIDETYCGDNDQWMFPVYAARETNIEKGTRICQFRVFKHQPEIEFITVDTLGNEDRGGFGSTGEK